MKYIKTYEASKLQNRGSEILGAKVGDVIIYNYDNDTIPIKSPTDEYLKRNQRYIITKIFDIIGTKEKSEITDPNDFIEISDLNGENMEFFGDSSVIRAHYFDLEFLSDVNKYNL